MRMPAPVLAFDPEPVFSPESQTIRSPWLGDIQLTDPQCELFFPNGLPGFEAHRRMVPVEIPAQRPLVYLQSLDSAEVCFLSLPVFVVDSEFQLRLHDDERAILQMPEDFDPAIGVDILCLAFLMPCGQTVEANLNAPIVINLHNRRGVQCVPPGGIAATFRLLDGGIWERVSPC